MTQESNAHKLPEPLFPDLEPPLYPPPKQIGKYKIEALIARGGMSAIYLGIHPETQEPALIKVLLPNLLSQPEFIRRFLNEAQIISLCDHPNIVKLYDFGKWEGGCYIAMEYIKGMSLRDILVNQPFSLKRSLEIILQISYAVCHLHCQGIVHGDLKPENILITDQGQVKIIDFGIASTLGEKAEKTPTQTPWLIGTPIYMSPEVHENPQNLSYGSDIYSLGIIAFELALGKITHGKVILSLAPRGMQKILNKALQPRPEDRYHDIVDFITDIATYIKSGQIQKDKQGSDYFFELFEQLETFQNKLLSHETPAWSGMEIGATHIYGMGLNGLYYEFLEIDKNRKGIIIAETGRKGADGILYSSMLYSCTHAFIDTLKKENTPAFLLCIEQQLVNIGIPSQCTYFEINLQNNTYEFYASQYGMLSHWSHIKQKIYSSEHDMIPTPLQNSNAFKVIKGGWDTQDRFLLLGYPIKAFIEVSTKNIPPQSLLEEAFLSTVDFSAQKQVDVILRKMRVKGEFIMDEHPLSMICFCME
jgi:eukaryotic-like serine/threonine-protein kinase